jgi:hypothetical protein
LSSHATCQPAIRIAAVAIGNSARCTGSFSGREKARNASAATTT